jgi:GT2 family glycosyltransferase
MISIVMAYYNRISLLRFTLKTFLLSNASDYEIIIVDDFSDSAHDPNLLKDEFPTLPIRIIKMSDLGEKTWCNPCIPYNVGFRASVGDKIIIQNPECCHLGDVISYTSENLTDENYLSYHCYACKESDLDILHNGGIIDMPNEKDEWFWSGWYNHKEYRPASFHFTTAITRNNLKKLNGFDERFAHGIGYDDNEFIIRVKRLGLKIDYVEDPMVVHQFHAKINSFTPDKLNNETFYKETKGNKSLIRVENQANIV